MNFLRVYGNKIYNLNHVKTIGIHTNIANQNYIEIEWTRHKFHNGAIVRDVEQIYQNKYPKTFNKLEEYINNPNTEPILRTVDNQHPEYLA